MCIRDRVGELFHQLRGETRGRGRHADRSDVAGRIGIHGAGRGDDEEVGTETFPVHAAQAGDLALERLAGDIEAVSYTHLDVYKRQALGVEGWIADDEIVLLGYACGDVVPAVDERCPVSYTHLDVYKRQT